MKEGYDCATLRMLAGRNGKENGFLLEEEFKDAYVKSGSIGDTGKLPSQAAANLLVDRAGSFMNSVPIERFFDVHKQLGMINSKTFNSSTIPRFSDVFPQAVVAGDFIFISGTIGIDPATGNLDEDFEQQAKQAFMNIKTILEELGSSLSNVVKTTVFMVSGNDFGSLNRVYQGVFPENPPARSTPQVMPFPSGIKISVECIATL